MHVEMRPIGSVTPYERNPRKNAQAVAKVARSLQEFGFRQPIVVDGAGTVVVGHTRLQAAQSLGITHVPVHVAEGLTGAQIRAYRIMDNRSHEDAEWDEKLLAVELGDLNDAGYALELTGFGTDELDRLLGSIGATSQRDPEATPEPPAAPYSRLGDIWVCGPHRVICGDATNAGAVAAVLAGAKPHLMVTDPPYGVEYDAGWRNEAMPQKNDPNRWKDGAGRPTGRVSNDDRMDWHEAWALFPGDVAYVWHAGRHASAVQASLEAADFQIRCQLIWAKQQFAIGRGHYHWQHEPCWYAVRKGGTGHWVGDRAQTTLWQIDKPAKSETGHSTQKPVECMRRPIENNSMPGDAVYDPFVGSGTTLIAAEQTGRRCYAVEINPAYVDVTVRRWQEFSGGKAVRESDGALFDSLTTLAA